jgi:small-conductance mechanosensitive channel
MSRGHREKNPAHSNRKNSTTGSTLTPSSVSEGLSTRATKMYLRIRFSSFSARSPLRWSFPTTLAALTLIAGIWGLKQNEIALFASTIFTALGIAFFAQWSLLSNITSSIILFFNHPLKLGDTIKVLDKDYPFEGEITELSYFFIHLKTQTGEIITIPNSLVLQKSISVVVKRENE